MARKHILFYNFGGHNLPQTFKDNFLESNRQRLQLFLGEEVFVLEVLGNSPTELVTVWDEDVYAQPAVDVAVDVDDKPKATKKSKGGSDAVAT